MAKKATKRENGEGYVEKMKSGNYACTIYSKYIDPNTLKYKKDQKNDANRERSNSGSQKGIKSLGDCLY